MKNNISLALSCRVVAAGLVLDDISFHLSSKMYKSTSSAGPALQSGQLNNNNNDDYYPQYGNLSLAFHHSPKNDSKMCP